MIPEFVGDQLKGRLYALLFQPQQVPEVAILDAATAQGKREDFISIYFLQRLGVHNQPLGSHVNAIGVE